MIKYTLKSKSTDNEIILALIASCPFGSFELIEDGLHAYLSEDDKEQETDIFLDALSINFPYTYTKQELEYQNWNKIWESNFPPVLVDDYCMIRADFHKAIPGYQYEIIINPKMAFGTGHHETTFMMLQLMRDIDFKEKSIFDYGAGTGVLSIMASYEGANNVTAIDIESESYLNTIENCDANHVHNVTSLHGTLESIEKTNRFDVILANINRQVLLDSAYDLHKLSDPSATLLLSGILKVDIDLVKEKYESVGFKFDKIEQKGEWVAMKFIIS